MDQHGAAAGRRSTALATASATAHLFSAQQAALDELMTGMDAEKRWVLLLGAKGSGKSTVIHALLDELRLAAATVAMFEGRIAADVDQLVSGLRERLGLPRKRTILGDDRSVSDIVANQSQRRTPLVVVVDDADALSTASMKLLAGLAAGTTRTDNACYVVLAGTPTLHKSGGRAWAKRGSPRGSVRSILKSMTSAEVHRYVEEWTRSHGDASVKFSETAIENIEMYCKGRPGLIAELCTRAVMLPATRLTNQVSAEAVAQAAEHLGLGSASDGSAEGVSEGHRRSRRSLARWAALVIGAATIAGLLAYVGPTLIRMTPRLIATSGAWLGLARPAVDRSTSETVRSRYDEARRELAVPSVKGAAAVSPTMSSNRPVREPRPAEKTQRAIAAAPSARQVAALMARARDGETDELARLIAGGVSPNVRDANGFTPLMAAVINDRVPAARVLLDRGAEINARGRGGLTALMLGIINDRPDAVKLLLAHGADTNAQTGAGWTALTFAAWKGDAALVRALLSHGARPNVIDKQGWTPLDYAPQKLAPADAGPQVDVERGSSGAPPN